MHFYQNKHGRLVALLSESFYLHRCILPLKKNFSKLSAVRDDLFALRISDPKLNSLRLQPTAYVRQNLVSRF